MEHYYQVLRFKNKLFRFSVIFGEDFLNLTVFENVTAWNVNIPRDDIIKQSKDGDFHEFYSNLKKYLVTCPEDVEFNFTNGKFTIHLLLKNKMKILFFSSTLKQVEFLDYILKLVDKLHSEKTQHLEELNGLKGTQSFLQEENKNLKEKMEVLLQRRQSEEQMLYNKFLAVLNEKKYHIQHLNDLITFRRKEPAVNSSVYTRNAEKKKSRPEKGPSGIALLSTQNSDSSISDTYNTDNEKSDNDEASHIRRVLPIANSSSPGTSKTKPTILGDSPTLLLPLNKGLKRIRTDSSENGNTCSAERNEEPPQKIMTCTDYNKKDCNEFIPKVNFSTQDLLDNL